MALVVKARKMTLSERLYFPNIIKGMLLTLAHMFKKSRCNIRKSRKYYPSGIAGLIG